MLIQLQWSHTSTLKHTVVEMGSLCKWCTKKRRLKHYRPKGTLTHSTICVVGMNCGATCDQLKANATTEFQLIGENVLCVAQNSVQ